jgi:hypothetical protein
LSIRILQEGAAGSDTQGENLIIMVHEDAARADQVAESARRSEIAHGPAVDRPAGEYGWFGATFKDYGVRGIPAAAVIDRKDQVAFVGRFPEALEQAAKRLGPEGLRNLPKARPGYPRGRSSVPRPDTISWRDSRRTRGPSQADDLSA